MSSSERSALRADATKKKGLPSLRGQTPVETCKRITDAQGNSILRRFQAVIGIVTTVVARSDPFRSVAANERQSGSRERLLRREQMLVRASDVRRVGDGLQPT